MAMTWRKLINAALSTVGSATIPVASTTITDTYQLQVAEFANQIYEEVWSACQWRALWTTFSFQYPANAASQQISAGQLGTPYSPGPAGNTGTIIINGTPTAAITTTGAPADAQAVVNAINAISGTTLVTAVITGFNSQILLSAAIGATITVAYGGGANVTAAITGLPAGSYTVFAPNSNCSVIRMMNPQAGYPVALCFDVTSVGIPFPLREAPIADLIYMNEITATQPVQYSTHFAVQDLGNDVVNMVVYPVGSTARFMQLTLYNPPARFDPTLAGTGPGALDSPILIPYKPILMGTIWQIFEERGEELGMNSQYTELKYRTALDDAVSRDTGDAGGLVLLVD